MNETSIKKNKNKKPKLSDSPAPKSSFGDEPSFERNVTVSRDTKEGPAVEENKESSEDLLERNLANVEVNAASTVSPNAVADKEDDDEEQLQEISPEYELFMRGKSEASMQQMKLLLEVMSEDQLRRYETYRSAAFTKNAMKKVVQQILNQNVPERMVVMLSGIAKLFVGELVEIARDIIEENDGDATVPIRPAHLREALRIKQMSLKYKITSFQ